MRCNHLGDHHGRRRFAHEPFGRGPFGQRGRMGRGFGRRHFESGDLRFVILHLLAEKPRHGYEIIKAIEDHFGGMYSPSPGVIYPTLTLLEELGYAGVAATEEGGKKLYAITDAGRNFLAENRATLDEVLARFEAISRAYGGGAAPRKPARRAYFKALPSLPPRQRPPRRAPG